MEDTFEINNFNVISDDEYYYVFRALNNADSNDISNGITSQDGQIERVRTDRERWEEENKKESKYPKTSEISLEEMWDHIRINYSKETNCISLSSNSNASIDYGQGYNREYIMVKITKTGAKNVYSAGKYMLGELNKIIENEISNISADSPIHELLNEVESSKTANESKIIASQVFKKAKSEGKYIGTNTNLDKKVSISDRFSKKQYFNKEQQLEYNKIIAKLTILEMYGHLRHILPRTNDNSSLIATIGSAFSSGELIHYKDIQPDEFTQVSEEMMDVISLIQQAKEKNPQNEKMKLLEKDLIKAINSGTKFLNPINNLQNKTKISSVEYIYRLTDGKIQYEKARITMEFIQNLIDSRIKTANYVKQMRKQFDSNNEYKEIFDEIEKSGFVIDQKIINRENNSGMQIADSVNIGLDRRSRTFLPIDEQEQIIHKIESLSLDELTTDRNQIDNLYKSILEDLNENSNQISENRYFAETIIDGLDVSKIYPNAIKEKSLKEEQREALIAKLEQANCQKLYNAFKSKGIEHSEISNYIINLMMDGGYKGHSLEELSNLDNLNEIIGKNVDNNMLKPRITPYKFDNFIGITDDENVVEGSSIKLRDYQQETVDKIDDIWEDEKSGGNGKRFAGVVLPTGAGKSFVAITEMLKNSNQNILYFAPQNEILNQMQRHILKNVLNIEVLTNDEIAELKRTNQKPPEGKIYPEEVKSYIEKAFPHLKMWCYQSLVDKANGKENSTENDESGNLEEVSNGGEITSVAQLRDVLKNADADLIVLDELHRTGAKTWKPLIKQLIDNNKNAKILGMTATPVRDVDQIDMMREIAKMTGEYSEEELDEKEYLASEMNLLDAIREGLVVEPKIVTFNYTLKESDEYIETQRLYEKEKIQIRKKNLKKS